VSTRILPPLRFVFPCPFGATNTIVLPRRLGRRFNEGLRTLGPTDRCIHTNTLSARAALSWWDYVGRKSVSTSVGPLLVRRR
jgi:hypothetical protein